MSLKVSKLQLSNILDLEKYIKNLNDTLKRQERLIKNLSNEIKKNKRSLRTELTMALMASNESQEYPLTWTNGGLNLYTNYFQNQTFYGLGQNNNVLQYTFMNNDNPNNTGTDYMNYPSWNSNIVSNAYTGSGWNGGINTLYQTGTVQINSATDNADGTSNFNGVFNLWIYNINVGSNTPAGVTFPFSLLIGGSVNSVLNTINGYIPPINSIEIDGSLFSTYSQSVVIPNIGSITIPNNALALYPYIMSNTSDYTEWHGTCQRVSNGGDSSYVNCNIYVKFIWDETNFYIVTLTVGQNGWACIEYGQLNNNNNNNNNNILISDSVSLTMGSDPQNGSALIFYLNQESESANGGAPPITFEMEGAGQSFGCIFNFITNPNGFSVQFIGSDPNTTNTLSQGFGSLLSTYSQIPNNWYDQSQWHNLYCISGNCNYGN